MEDHHRYYSPEAYYGGRGSSRGKALFPLSYEDEEDAYVQRSYRPPHHHYHPHHSRVLSRRMIPVLVAYEEEPTQPQPQAELQPRLAVRQRNSNSNYYRPVATSSSSLEAMTTTSFDEQLRRRRRRQAALSSVSRGRLAPAAGPPLRVRFGSKKITVYDKPLQHHDILVVPALFGEEPNVTLYHDLRHEIQQLITHDVQNKTWQHEFNHKKQCLIVVKGVKKGSPTCRMVVQRICEYYKLRHDNLGVSMALRRGAAASAFRGGGSHVKGRNILVVASFGVTREVALLQSSSSSAGNSALDDDDDDRNNNSTLLPTGRRQPALIYLPQPNNTVISMGPGVQSCWLYGTNSLQQAPSQEHHHQGVVHDNGDDDKRDHCDYSHNDETITVVIRGQSDAVDTSHPATQHRHYQQRAVAASSYYSPHHCDRSVMTTKTKATMTTSDYELLDEEGIQE